MKEYIESTLDKVFQPSINKIKQNKEEGFDSNANDLRHQEFLEKQKQLQSNQLRLLEIKKEKIELMQKIAEVRAGPEQRQLVENLCNEAKLDSLKFE